MINKLRILFWALSARIIANFDFGKFAFVYGPRKMKNTALMRYEEETVNSLDIIEFEVLVDIGANIGIFSKMFEKKVELFHVLVEPDIRLIKLLDRNMRHKKDKLIMPVGCSDKVGLSEFYLHKNPLVNSASSNTSSVGTNYSLTTVVPFFTLDDILASAKLGAKRFVIKLDIEGDEVNIFSGSSLVRGPACVGVVLEIGASEYQNLDAICEMIKSIGFQKIKICDTAVNNNKEVIHCNLVAHR